MAYLIGIGNPAIKDLEQRLKRAEGLSDLLFEYEFSDIGKEEFEVKAKAYIDGEIENIENELKRLDG